MCSQTGKKLRAHVSDLSKEDMTTIKERDFREGSSFLAEIDGRPYPVQFMHFSGMYTSVLLICVSR